MKEKLKAIARYLWARLSEPSSYKGALTSASAIGGLITTHKFNPADPAWLEALTWGGLFLVGLIQVIAPQSWLYGPKK